MFVTISMSVFIYEGWQSKGILHRLLEWGSGAERGTCLFEAHVGFVLWEETTVVACKHRNKKEQTCVTKRVTL